MDLDWKKTSARTIVTLALACAGCGGAAMHAHDTTYLPGGKRLESDYWLVGGQLLVDPVIGEIARKPDGSWSVRRVKLTTDNQGIAAVVPGAIDLLAKLFGAP